MIASLATAAAPALIGVIERLGKTLFPDDEKKQTEFIAMGKHAVEKMSQSDERQVKLLLADLQSNGKSLFHTGWRPCVAWICVFGFAYSVVAAPLLAFAGIQAPPLDGALFDSILMGMLGLGAIRSLDKFNGVTR